MLYCISTSSPPTADDTFCVVCLTPESSSFKYASNSRSSSSAVFGTLSVLGALAATVGRFGAIPLLGLSPRSGGGTRLLCAEISPVGLDIPGPGNNEVSDIGRGGGGKEKRKEKQRFAYLLIRSRSGSEPILLISLPRAPPGPTRVASLGGLAASISIFIGCPILNNQRTVIVVSNTSRTYEQKKNIGGRG